MKRAITRRTLLRGVGAGLGLPWLEAMAATPKSKPPVRMCAMYMPNGVHPDTWTPGGEGREFALSPTLAPLADLKDHVLVPTNLWNAASKGGDGHYVKMSGWLTSTTITKTLGVDISCNGTSVDQVAAQRAGHLTPLASLELGTSPATTGVDRNVGYTRVYGAHIAWSGPTTPLAKEIQPRLVWERLFRATQPPEATAKRDALLLDLVLSDARELRTQLGATDRHRLDEYLTGVRALEERLTKATRPERRAWKPLAAMDPARKPGVPKDYDEHVRLMMDMIALAFQTDTTRIATFMFANEVANTKFPFLEGVTDAHHEVSHHQREADKLRQYERIARWHIEQYAYLLRRLREMKEGEQTVLDNAMVLWGSGIRDGDRHDPHNLPLVLGGRGGGKIQTGQHLVAGPDTPLANLFVTMLEAFGTPVERFADSTGKLAGASV